MTQPSSSNPLAPSSFQYVVGIDIGSQSCSFCVLKPDKQIAIKPTDYANTAAGFAVLFEKLGRLGVPADQILVGLEATSRYGEPLYHVLLSRGYHLCLLHPAQTHHFAQQRGLRAKTDHLDAITIARLLLSGEARPGYVPTELVAAYRELVRLHMQLSDEAARYQNEIHALLVVQFPEFMQVFVDPCRPTALAVLKRYPNPQAIVKAGVATLAQRLHQLSPRHYGRATAEQLVALVGDVDRFSRVDQAVAYAGLDLEVKESGKWKGQTKLSKRGSGLLRRILYLAALRSVRLEGSAFGAYYHRLVDRGMKKGMALVAVMRKMLIVAVRLIKTEESYDPAKVSSQRIG
jgi:transposase